MASSIRSSGTIYLVLMMMMGEAIVGDFGQSLYVSRQTSTYSCYELCPTLLAVAGVVGVVGAVSVNTA